MDDGKRRDERVSVNRQFSSVETFISKYATNISRSGAFIRTDQIHPVGTEFHIRFTVVTQQIDEIIGKGRVVRVSDDPPGMGVEFLDLTEDSLTFIDRLVGEE